MIFLAKRNPSEALMGRQFSLYFEDSMSSLTTPNGTTNTLNRISSVTLGTRTTWLWRGFFKPSSNADYQFRTTSDDASYLWLGTNGRFEDTNLNTSDAIVQNGGLHGSTTVTSSKYTLSAGLFYPIAIVAGNYEGPGSITVEFTDGNFGWVSDGTGFYFRNPRASNGYNL